MDARLFILKAFNKTDYRLQGLCFCMSLYHFVCKMTKDRFCGRDREQKGLNRKKNTE